MHNCLKYFTLLTLSPLPLISLSPLTAQAQTYQQQKNQALRLYQLGIQQFNQGQFQEALKTFEQGLVIVRQIRERRGEGVILNEIGGVYRSLGEYAKALEFLQQALAIYKQIDDKASEGGTLNNIGLVYNKLGEYPKALAFYQQALAIHKEIDNKGQQGGILENIGSVHNRMGDYTQALDFFEQALAIYKKSGDKGQQGGILNNIGSVYNQRGEYTKALDLFEQALAIHQEVGNKAQQGINLNNIGSVYNQRGEYTKALEFFGQALAIDKEIGNKAEQVTVFNNIGLTYDNLGQYAKGLEFFGQALVIAKEIGDKAGEGVILNNIGSVYRNLRQYPQALKFLEQALVIRKQIGDKFGEGKTVNNIGEVHRNLEKYPQALKFFQQALVIHKEIGDKQGEGTTINNIGEVYRNLRQYPQALELFQQALVIHKQIGDKQREGTTINNIGEVYRNLGKYPEALELFQQSNAIAKQISDKLGEGITLNNIGAIYNRLGQYYNAEKTLFAAVEIWESLRPGLTDDQKISIFENQAETYRFLIHSLIAQDKIEAALEVADRARARAFVELLASKRLEKPNAQFNIKPLTIQQIKEIAKIHNATLIQYSTTWNNALYIWVAKPTGEIFFEQVDPQKSLDTSLKELVNNSRQSMGARGRGINVEPTGGGQQTQQLQKLHEILIKPIASHLPTNPNARVIFIPQDSLFLVPFPALQDEQGKYLIEKHTILTAPAIQVLDLTRFSKLRSGKRGVGSEEILVVGNPTMPKVPIANEQLLALPGAEIEAIKIANLFKTKAITGSKATETSIVQKMTKARIIHFATHGLLDDFKGLGVPGAMVFAAGGQDDGFLTAGEILDMKLNAELVVLSACNTGVGNITGDGVIGLSRSLITAGVPSVIVSLWSVPDNSTAFLMTEFYQNLQKNPDKAVALRQAMLTTKQKYSNPIDWAAFTLIGEAE
ncbi:CHAT domain-containing protein [Cylindrospermum sp. FACHB-282]|uniref:CHAT domain-containing protein n=1 Tax=Cylindrospermum sp. FACHB-282 TaxID=2692794 RepID=UPI00168932E0|nr:CHAT domain-containing tetratricopeptide repeat protein [Cylindrospermum sp. FACHB-282]MBD2384210.1 tetratricopeptide repeat protein [Cylindrospermum sp. FACHB-282]